MNDMFNDNAQSYKKHEQYSYGFMIEILRKSIFLPMSYKSVGGKLAKRLNLDAHKYGV